MTLLAPRPTTQNAQQPVHHYGQAYGGAPNPQTAQSAGANPFSAYGGGGGGKTYYGGATTPEQGRANFQQANPNYSFQSQAPQTGGPSMFQPGGNTGNYPTTYFQSPFQNAQRPSQTITRNVPVSRWGRSPSGRVDGGGNRRAETGWNTTMERRTGRNPNYGAQMRNYNAQQLLNQYTQAHNQGKYANEQRYRDILGGYQDLSQMAGDLHGSRQRNLAGTVNNISQSLNQGYQDRYDQGMGMVDTSRDGSRDRINRHHDNQIGGMGQTLTNRGLNNTTIAGSMQNAIERNRGDQHRMLDEQILQQQLGAHTQLSGDQMSAQQQNMWQGLGYLDNAQLAAIQDQLGIPMQQLQFMERREDEYPSMNELIQLYMGLGRGF